MSTPSATQPVVAACPTYKAPLPFPLLHVFPSPQPSAFACLLCTLFFFPHNTPTLFFPPSPSYRPLVPCSSVTPFLQPYRLLRGRRRGSLLKEKPGVLIWGRRRQWTVRRELGRRHTRPLRRLLSSMAPRDHHLRRPQRGTNSRHRACSTLFSLPRHRWREQILPRLTYLGHKGSWKMQIRRGTHITRRETANMDIALTRNANSLTRTKFLFTRVKELDLAL